MWTALAGVPRDVARLVRARYERHWRAHDAERLALMLTALSEWRAPSFHELERLTQHALVRAWPGDDVHPLSLAERIVAALPNARLVVVDRALHYDVARDQASLAHCFARLARLDGRTT
jgi:hypothetical protein